MTITPDNIVPAEAKSPFLSKTNITGALLSIFGLLTAFGKLPAEYSTPEFVGGVVAAGGVVVIAFRTFTNSVLGFFR
jgi:hypothetical protein